MSAELEHDLALETAQRMLAVQSRAEALRSAWERRGPRDFWNRVAEYLEVLPTTKRLNGFGRSSFGINEPRICSGCFKTISEAEWETLESLGAQVFPPYEDDPGEVLDMRNHYCGSTLTALEPYTAREFEENVEFERKRHPDWSLKMLRREVFNNMHANINHYRG